MSRTPQRIAVKLFAHPDPGPALELHPFIGLFHGFVQERRLEGLLIDVADYAHVPGGPGILLVGHDVDYGLDLAGGRTGLLTTRKRYDSGLPLADVLRDTLRKALAAVHAVEASGVGKLHFRTDALELQILDRLVAPNTEASWEALRAEVEPALAELYGDAKLEIAREAADDARRPLTFRVTAQEAPSAEALLGRLGGAAPTVKKQSDWDISVEDLKKLRDEGAGFVLVDVREPDEYETCNLGGKLIPLGSLSERLSELERGAHVVVHCKSGGRSAKAVELLRGAGFDNAWNVQGGILAWIDRIDPSLPRY